VGDEQEGEGIWPRGLNEGVQGQTRLFRAASAQVRSWLFVDLCLSPSPSPSPPTASRPPPLPNRFLLALRPFAWQVDGEWPNGRSFYGIVIGWSLPLALQPYS
jgi:hypothetical protein